MCICCFGRIVQISPVDWTYPSLGRHIHGLRYLYSAHSVDRRGERSDYERQYGVSAEKEGYVRALGNVQFDHRKMTDFEI